MLVENNGGWLIDGFDARDTTNNTLSFSGYDGLYQYTLAANLEDTDMDGIRVTMDNCPDVANADQADTDNDLVGDACDECANGDDLVDANNNSIIDDCECKGSDLTITGDLITDSVYVASNSIESNEMISSSRNIIYKAPISITLSMGFHAAAGVSFLATISDCQSIESVEPVETIIKQSTSTPNLVEAPTLTVYPNPFITTTNISYFIPQKDKLSMTIHDLKGQELGVLIDNQSVDKGHYQLDFAKENLVAVSYTHLTLPTICSV